MKTLARHLHKMLLQGLCKMPNMRIVYNNAAKRNSTLTASSTAGTLSVSNLLIDAKSSIWRSTSTSATLTITWGSTETVSAVVLPFCSLTATATMRVRGYSDSAGTTLVLDTTARLCAKGSPVSAGSDWSNVAFGANYYATGGFSTATSWFSPTGVQRLVIDIVDSSNALGYIEAACLMVGNYWSPTYNIEFNDANVSVNETTKNERSDSGDVYSDRGYMYRSMTIPLNHMPSADRDKVWRILRGNGMTSPVFVSVSPESTDSYEEQMYSLYGKLSKNSNIQYQFVGQFATSLSVDEL